MSRTSFERSRPGRPRLRPERRRSRTLDLWLSDPELFWVQWRAQEAGLPVFCLIRELALYAPLPTCGVPQAARAAVGQIGYLGHFLNQAMHRLNAGRLAPELPLLLEDTQALLESLLAQLGEASE